MLKHIPRLVLRPGRHVPEHVLEQVPRYWLKHVPKLVLKHMPDKHMPGHVNRQVPKNVPKRKAHAVLMTKQQRTT